MNELLTVLALLPLGYTIAHHGAIGWWALRSSSGDRARSHHVALAGDHPRGPSASRPSDARDHDPAVPGVSIIMPAHDEEPVIVAAIHNALAQDHRLLEIVVIDDGSTDGTLQAVIEAFGLVAADLRTHASLPTTEIVATYHSPAGHDGPPILAVAITASGSKAGATNAGINFARHPYVVIRDADGLMEADVISRCVTEAEHSPVPMIAIGATLLPANECQLVDNRVRASRVSRNPLVGAQTIEYLIAFFLSRPGMAAHGVLPFVSGGFGLFSREAVLAVGGFTPGHLGEDLDLCIRLHRHHLDQGIPYAVTTVPEAIVWTEVPSDRAQLRQQRRRWQWGLQAVVGSHRDLLYRSNHGRLGVIGYGFLHVFEWWGLFIEVAGWALTLGLVVAGVVRPDLVLTAFLTAQLFSFLVTSVAVQLGVRRTGWHSTPNDLLLLALWAAFFAFVYRPLTAAWRLGAILAVERTWGDMTRRGFASTDWRLT